MGALSDIVYYAAVWATEKYNVTPAIAAMSARKREKYWQV